MSLFHTHFFKESQKDPEILFGHCGETRDLHRHVWEMDALITEKSSAYAEGHRNIGRTLKCKICGKLEVFEI